MGREDKYQVVAARIEGMLILLRASCPDSLRVQFLAVIRAASLERFCRLKNFSLIGFRRKLSVRLGQEKERDFKVERVTLRLRYLPPAVVGSKRNAHKSTGFACVRHPRETASVCALESSINRRASSDLSAVPRDSCGTAVVRCKITIRIRPESQIEFNRPSDLRPRS